MIPKLASMFALLRPSSKTRSADECSHRKKLRRAQAASHAVRELTVSGDDFLFAACETSEGGTEIPTVKLKREVGAGADACKLLVGER